MESRVEAEEQKQIHRATYEIHIIPSLRITRAHCRYPLEPKACSHRDLRVHHRIEIENCGRDASIFDMTGPIL